MKIPAEKVEQFRKMAANWLFNTLQLSTDDVLTGSDAWIVACKSGITEQCYGNTAKDIPAMVGVNDAHIRTALEKIFPNAVFKDKKVY